MDGFLTSVLAIAVFTVLTVLIMRFNKLSGILELPAKADKSAVCAINRHLLVSGVFA